MRRVDVAIVGAGVMGTSAARWLARSGRSVVVLEQFDVGHARGSSHGASRIFRLSYPDEAYVEMAQESLALWRSLESESGETLLTTTGGIDAGEGIELNARALEAHGIACELTDGRVASRRWPQLRFPDAAPILWQADSGVIAADRTVALQARLAAEQGAELRERWRVEGLEPEQGSVVVRGGGETIRASVCVVTAGAWARGLLESAGIELEVSPTRETVAYYHHPGPMPPTLVEWGRPSRYGLSSFAAGIKLGEHIAGPPADPDEPGEADAGSVARLTRWVAERYPAADPTPHHAETCLYTNTADEHFVLQRHGPVVVGSACSGHGFKFGPLIGRRLAELAGA